MARKPIIDVEEVTVRTDRKYGVKRTHFSNGHFALGEARQCFRCQQTWPNLWDPLAPCPLAVEPSGPDRLEASSFGAEWQCDTCRRGAKPCNDPALCRGPSATEVPVKP